VSEFHHRSKSDKNTDPVSEEILVLRKSIEHLTGALGMTDVGYLCLSCHFSYVLNGSRDIIFAHVCEGETPIVLV
jgi:hypothetical protein